MHSLRTHRNAAADLEALWQTDPIAAADLEVFVQEAQDDPWWLDRLSQNGFNLEGDPDTIVNINVSWWEALWRGKPRRNILRLKRWELERLGHRYRVIYMFEPAQLRYTILGFVPRAFNYDRRHPYTQRILAAYDELVR